jgi:hypothetical protein
MDDLILGKLLLEFPVFKKIMHQNSKLSGLPNAPALNYCRTMH